MRSKETGLDPRFASRLEPLINPRIYLYMMPKTCIGAERSSILCYNEELGYFYTLIRFTEIWTNDFGILFTRVVDFEVPNFKNEERTVRIKDHVIANYPDYEINTKKYPRRSRKKRVGEIIRQHRIDKYLNIKFNGI